jgi:hypothetical protein
MRSAFLRSLLSGLGLAVVLLAVHFAERDGPQRHHDHIALASLLSLAVLLPWSPLTFGPAARRRRWFLLRTLPTFAVAAVLLLVSRLLADNAVNVASLPGRIVYGALAVVLVAVFLGHCFVQWLLDRRHRLSRSLPVPPRLFAGATSVALGTLLLLFAVEAIARAVPVVDSQANNPGIRHLWPAYFDDHNSLGFNDREPGRKRGPRILVLGGSCAEGAGVAKSERFSARLERLLDGTEVYSAGVCGLGTFEAADVLDRIGDAVEPDVVVVGYVLNDAEGENPPSRRPATAVERFFLQRLGSYAFYRALVWSKRPDPTDYWDQVRRQHGDDSPGWRRAEKGLDRIAEWCDRRCVRKLLVVFPVFVADADAARDVMDKVESAARRRCFEARSTLDDFDGAWHRVAVSTHDEHPGTAAHAVIARGLAQMIGTPCWSYDPGPRCERDESMTGD